MQDRQNNFEMTQLVLDKRSRILNLMSDNRPRSLPEIQKEVGEKCNSSVFNLYEKGILSATDIKYFMHAIAYKGGLKYPNIKNFNYNTKNKLLSVIKNKIKCIILSASRLEVKKLFR